MAAMVVITATAFANPNATTPISGNFDGMLETKTFLPSRSDDRSESSRELNVQFLFNGNVFIYQAKDIKAMGNYTIEGDKVHFTVNSVKGDRNLADAIFGQEYTFSQSGDNLMLVGKSENTSNVRIYQLSRSAQ